LSRERKGVGQEIEVSLTYCYLGFKGVIISGCLITGEDAVRPQRRGMGNPIRNVYETKDKKMVTRYDQRRNIIGQISAKPSVVRNLKTIQNMPPLRREKMHPIVVK